MDRISTLWRTDPLTLRDTIMDEPAARARLSVCPLPEKLWLLALLGHEDQALDDGFSGLPGSPHRVEILLVLARIMLGKYRWRDAAQLQEQAFRLVSTRDQEALVRHNIGLRLFNEALYRDAAAEFEWASDLYRASGHDDPADASHHAMQRARELHLARTAHFTFKH
jgi:hypothetical protein